jgi:hypothetical protein
MSNQFKIESEKDETLCVYKTKQYDAFSNIVGNRDVNRTNVNKIKASMEIEHLKVPAIVNELGEVCDGQHRRLACKELNIPFYYIIINGYRLKEVQKINANQKNWNDMDYLNSFVKRHEHDGGFEDYVSFSETLKESELSGVSSLLTIATDGCTNKTVNDYFREGRMININWGVVDEMLNELSALSETLPKKWGTKAFIAIYMAMSRMSNFKSTHFLQMCDKHPTQVSKIEEAGNKNRLLTLTVELYNNMDKGVARSKAIFAEEVKYELQDTNSIQW